MGEHVHGEGCDCGCEGEGIGISTVTLTLDDDEVVECEIIVIFPANGKEYIALTPVTDDEEEESDLYLYRFIDNGDEKEPELANIETDEEYEIVADAFDEWIDSQDFENLD